MGFSAKVKEDALVLCARHCCLCHLHKGLKMEVHHIVQHSEGGLDVLDNAIPLCFECHADMRSYDHNHPKGLKYTRSELVRRRDDWYAIVKQRGLLPQEGASGAADKPIFQHVNELLPWSGSINFIRHNNFAGFAFDLNNLRDIDAFLGACSNPGFRFSDFTLEQERAHLQAHLTQFTRAIGRNTFRVDNTDSHSHVPPEWEFQQPEHFERAVNEIESSANAACDAYDRLIERGRVALGIVALG